MGSKATSSKTDMKIKTKRKSKEPLNDLNLSTKRKKKSKSQNMTKAESEKSKIKSVKKKQKKQRKKAQLIKQVKEQVSSDEDDQCAAVDQNGRPGCKHPDRNYSGDKDIPWICCDECGLWFHCACVGLTKEQADNINSYMCKTCKTNMDNVDVNSSDEDD